VISHRWEQFNGNPTVTSEPARTAFELSDPRHAPTSDCGLVGMVAGAVTVVGEVGAAAVPVQLLNRSAAVIGTMRMEIRTAQQIAT
jgi:hypothetical protein